VSTAREGNKLRTCRWASHHSWDGQMDNVTDMMLDLDRCVYPSYLKRGPIARRDYTWQVKYEQGILGTIKKRGWSA